MKGDISNSTDRAIEEQTLIRKLKTDIRRLDHDLDSCNLHLLYKVMNLPHPYSLNSLTYYIGIVLIIKPRLRLSCNLHLLYEVINLPHPYSLNSLTYYLGIVVILKPRLRLSCNLHLLYVVINLPHPYSLNSLTYYLGIVLILRPRLRLSCNLHLIIIIIIMVVFKCYFSGELIALS